MKDFAKIEIKTTWADSGYVLTTTSQEGEIESIHENWSGVQKRLDSFVKGITRKAKSIE